MTIEKGTKEDPWRLKTPPFSSDYEMYTDEKEGKKVIVCVVGKTTLLYDYRCHRRPPSMLKEHDDWMELGSADEQKPAKEGTVEAGGVQTTIPTAAGTVEKRPSRTIWNVCSAADGTPRPRRSNTRCPWK